MLQFIQISSGSTNGLTITAPSTLELVAVAVNSNQTQGVGNDPTGLNLMKISGSTSQDVSFVIPMKIPLKTGSKLFTSGQNDTTVGISS